MKMYPYGPLSITEMGLKFSLLYILSLDVCCTPRKLMVPNDPRQYIYTHISLEAQA